LPSYSHAKKKRPAFRLWSVGRACKVAFSVTAEVDDSAAIG
jgi:hypothetical protein